MLITGSCNSYEQWHDQVSKCLISHVALQPLQLFLLLLLFFFVGFFFFLMFHAFQVLDWNSHHTLIGNKVESCSAVTILKQNECGRVKCQLNDQKKKNPLNYKADWTAIKMWFIGPLSIFHHHYNCLYKQFSWPPAKATVNCALGSRVY